MRPAFERRTPSTAPVAARPIMRGSMELSMSLDPESGIVIGRCEGPMGVREGKEGVAKFWANPEYCGKPVLWDFRNARLVVRAAEVRALAQFVMEGQPSMPPPKVAIVTSRDVDFGLSRMYEVLREHPETEVRVFRDYEEAYAWVGAPKESPPAAIG